MNNLWWGEIETSEQAERILYQASSFSYFIAGVLVIYGALYGVMPPGASDLLFGRPDGGMIGAVPGVLYATLSSLLYRFTSRIAALAMTVLACEVIIDNSMYHYLPLSIFPILLVLWINIRSARAAFVWHQLTRLRVNTEVGVSHTRILNRLPWYGVIGVVTLLVAVPNIVQIAIVEQRMSPSKTVPCTIIGKHQVPPSLVVGGATGYVINCRFINALGEKQVISGRMPKAQWEALHGEERAQVQHRTIPPYSSRLRIADYAWVWHGALALVGGVLLVLGFSTARAQYRSRSGRNAGPASPDEVLARANRII